MIKESQKTDIQKKKKISGSDLQKQTIDLLLKTGWVTIRINSGRRGKLVFYRIENFEPKDKSSGFLDILAIKHNQVLLMEIKGDGDKLRPSQEKFMKLCALTGTDTYIIESLEDAINVLKKQRGLIYKIKSFWKDVYYKNHPKEAEQIEEKLTKVS